MQPRKKVSPGEKIAKKELPTPPLSIPKDDIPSEQSTPELIQARKPCKRSREEDSTTPEEKISLDKNPRSPAIVIPSSGSSKDSNEDDNLVIDLTQIL